MSSINNITTTPSSTKQANSIISALSLLPAKERIDVLKQIFADFIPEKSLNDMCADKTKKIFIATQICEKVLEGLTLNDLQPSLETETARHFLEKLTPQQKQLFTIALGKALGSIKPLKAGKKYLEAYFNPNAKTPINRKILHHVMQSEEGKKAVAASSSSSSYLKMFGCIGAVAAAAAGIFFSAPLIKALPLPSTPVLLLPTILMLPTLMGTFFNK